MDIQGNQATPERSKKAYEDQQRALIDSNRALVRTARENLTSVAKEHANRSTEPRPADTRRDEIRLSEAALKASEPSTAEREARVRQLTDEHRMGRLHTPERLALAAQRLLEG